MTVLHPPTPFFLLSFVIATSRSLTEVRGWSPASVTSTLTTISGGSDALHRERHHRHHRPDIFPHRYTNDEYHGAENVVLSIRNVARIVVEAPPSYEPIFNVRRTAITVSSPDDTAHVDNVLAPSCHDAATAAATNKDGDVIKKEMKDGVEIKRGDAKQRKFTGINTALITAPRVSTHSRQKTKNEKKRSLTLLGATKTRAPWTERYAELRKFCDTHGHTLVPQKYPPHPALGQWVMAQRRQHRLLSKGQKSSLTLERIRLLDDLGFAFAVTKRGPRNNVSSVAQRLRNASYTCIDNVGGNDGAYGGESDEEVVYTQVEEEEATVYDFGKYILQKRMEKSMSDEEIELAWRRRFHVFT